MTWKRLRAARGIDDLDRDRENPEGRPGALNAFASSSFSQTNRQAYQGSNLDPVRSPVVASKMGPKVAKQW